MLTEQQLQQQKKALVNRSFLYGNNATAVNKQSTATSVASETPTPTTAATSSSSSSSSCLISQKIVYATLDSLALRRASLQRHHQLTNARQSKQQPQHTSAENRNESRKIEEVTSALTHVQQSAKKSASGSSHVYTFPGLVASENKQPTKKKKTKKKSKDDSEPQHKRFAFAKNVLHYVPMQSRRYYRKSRKLASKSLSLKSLGHESDSTAASATLRSRSLSRDELKYISISQPSNFVHVDSGDRFRLVHDHRRQHQSAHVHDDRPRSEYAELALDSSIFLINNSFLWASQLCKLNESHEDDDYDDVGPPTVDNTFMHRETQECKAERTASAELVEELRKEEEQDVYDDVGPPVLSEKDEAAEEEEEEDQVYDDVGPLRQIDEQEQELESTVKQDKEEEEEEEEEKESQETYEIPQAPAARGLAEENPKDEEEEEEEDERAVELRESCVDDEDDDVYDDVGPAVAAAPIQESHERVNSLYSGSMHVYDKESEWEDLDEPNIDQANNPPRSKSKKSTANGAAPRWSCKIRRQRSKASRKSSARSTSRSRRVRPAVASGGSSLAEATSSFDSDSSDDGNYETLQTYEPDDFSSDSEAEEESSAGSAPSLLQQQQPPQQQRPCEPPPNRPIPPPPREESLSHSLGRRMKMLRRTWSITKGSLGRMRRRASSDVDDASGQPPSTQYDPRKYFSFKKHFGKSQMSGQGLSTFYLDKSASSEAGSEKDSCYSGNDDSPVYSNCNLYKEVGLYFDPRRSNGSQRESSFEQLTPKDPYSVLAEEPLYQFYAANATRVAFESDSDGYEEVEELTPSSATTDLAKPGHRTLWCQTPQVINSGLLRRLTSEERKIQEAKFEIITSEASYLNSLRVLENEFASNHELVHGILTGIERDKLFGSVPDVLVASERFLAELESVWREDPMLGRLSELLLKHADKCANVYVEYCSNQVNIDATLKELKAKKGYKYLETLSKIEMQPACQSLSLHSFLMLPMQRITRLPLLADAVLSKLAVEHSERLSWERVLASLSQIVAKCNEGARLAERRNEMEALARKLEYPAKVPPIDLRERELIRSGTVVQLSNKSETEYKLTFGKKFHKTPLMLMLLTDYLLVTKLKSNSNEETYSVMETCKRSLVALESAPEDGPFQGRHAMILTLLENHAGRQVEFVLTCDNDTEKERWLDAVSPPKPSCLGETLYESWDCPQVMALYSYSPQQPDEIALQPGDVINVLRKMNDGWLFGEKLLDGEQGWFPGNFTKEVASEHVRARNLRQRHRFLALSGSVLQRKAKQSLSLL